MDETYVVAPPAAVAAVVGEPAYWRLWWPDLRLTVVAHRGLAGVRWTITGALVGTMEVWLEPFADGVIVHYYLRADLAGAGSPAAEQERRAHRAKAVFWALKDRLEAGRPPGAPGRA